MSNVGNKYKVGVLAIVAFAILILGLVSLGTLKYFHTTYEFMTAVEGSVQGLDKGAKVKIKGVTIGSVERIHLGPEMKITYIYMKFDPQAFAKVATYKPVSKGLSKKEYTDIFDKRISDMAEQGMRCQLQYGDITGTMFVDIAIFNPDDYPPKELELPEDHPPYIPSLPIVSIGSIITDVQKATQNIAKIDMQQISADVKKLLDKANKIVDDKELGDIVKKIDSISTNLDDLVKRVNETLDKKRIDDITQSIQKTFDSFSTTLASVEKLSEETRNEIKNAKIAETSEKARNLIDASEESLKRLDSLKGDLKKNMDELFLTLENAKQLLDYLERNPNSVIYGKASSPVVDPE